MDYSLVLNVHAGLAIAALLIYVIRGIMMLASSTKTNSRGILSITSAITLALFGVGVYMAFSKGLSFADGYVLTKIIGLLLFVAFGVIGLKQGLSKIVASILWLLGLAAFIYTYLIGAQILRPLF